MRSNSIHRTGEAKASPVQGEVAPASPVPEGVYGNDFVGDYRTMAFTVSIAYTPSVTPDGVTAPPTQGSHWPVRNCKPLPPLIRHAFGVPP